MLDYNGKKISELVQWVEDDKLILPAIQRNFVWKETAVFRLFDSLLRGYPIGTFLFWQVEKHHSDDMMFNKFVREYKETRGESMARGEEIDLIRDSYYGVLDGQQRMTSIYLGLKGKFLMHIKGQEWAKTDSFEEKVLCVDVLAPKDSDSDFEYSLNLIPPNKTCRCLLDEDDAPSYWFPLGRAIDMEIWESVNELSRSYEAEVGDPMGADLQARAGGVLSAARDMLNSELSFFETDKDVWDVVDIFTRVNSGGQTLHASDLMLSIASAKSGQDIHAKAQDAIPQISNVGGDDTSFIANKDLLLRAGLMFSGAPSLSLKKRENWSQGRIALILECWSDMVDALASAAQYMELIGFNMRKITSNNILLPIAYYFYKQEITNGKKYSEDLSDSAAKDRRQIREWALRAMVKGIFGDSIPATLIGIRETINHCLANGDKVFPLDQLMGEGTKKSLVFNSEDIDAVLHYKYPDARIQPLLMMLSNADTATHSYHLDHIWAQASFPSLAKVRKRIGDHPDDAERYMRESQLTANLQLLTKAENIDKSNKDFGEWVKDSFDSEELLKSYQEEHCIPANVEYDFGEFLSFVDARRDLMQKKIEKKFGCK